ncbi:MAG: tetratricopeptide repeat protein [Sandaracinaceae bacterium]
MNSSARSAYQRGLSAASSGNLDQARSEFSRALSADSNAYKAAYNLGVIADRQGNESQAIQFYERALSIQADYERAIEGIARIHLRRGDTTRAVSFVRPLAERWVRNLHIQAIYGDVLVAANRPEEAITAARGALRRDERFVPAMVVLVKANLRLGRNDGRARSSIRPSRPTTTTPSPLLWRGCTRSKATWPRRSRAISARSSSSPPTPRPEWRSASSSSPRATTSRPSSSSARRRARPHASVRARLALGDALRATKSWQQAKAEFDRVQEMEPRNAEVHFDLAVMYQEAGENFPGMTKIDAYQRAVTEFNRYRGFTVPACRATTRARPTSRSWVV